MSFLPRPKVGGILANKHLPCRLHPRQLDPADQRDRIEPQLLGVKAAALSRLIVHLSQALPAGRSRKSNLLTRAAGAGLTGPMRSPRSPASRCAGATTGSTARATGSHADQPLRPGTTTSTWRTHTCWPALMRKNGRGNDSGREEGCRVGHRDAAARAALLRPTWPRPAVS